MKRLATNPILFDSPENFGQTGSIGRGGARLSERGTDLVVPQFGQEMEKARVGQGERGMNVVAVLLRSTSSQILDVFQVLDLESAPFRQNREKRFRLPFSPERAGVDELLIVDEPRSQGGQAEKQVSIEVCLRHAHHAQRRIKNFRRTGRAVARGATAASARPRSE